MGDVHNNIMIKHQINDNILVRQTGMGYSSGIQFEESLINTDKEKSLTKSNQPEKMR